MTTIAILDTETTGIDHATDTAIEVGLVTMSLEPLAITACYSSLIRCDRNPAESVNRIPADLLAIAPSANEVWDEVLRRTADCNVILAHNAEFDRGFCPEPLRAKRWICTMDDLAWPRGAGSKSLVALALAHGVGVSTAHRALTDCLLIAHTLERLPELGVVDVKAFLRRGLRPKAKFRALVSYETNSLAKAAGFRWEPNARMWTRTMAVEDVAGLPFKAVPVDADAVQAVA